MTATPARFVLLTPDDWWRIPLPITGERRRSVKALAKRQFRGMDDQPTLRTRLERELNGQVEEAAAAGGLEMYLAVEMRGMPVAATLTTYLVPAAAPDGAVELRETLGGDVDNVELPAGRAIRRRHTRGTAGTPAEGVEGAPRTTLVDYWIDVPGSAQMLMLEFSTPMEEIAEVMVGLFDVIAESVQWRDT